MLTHMQQQLKKRGHELGGEQGGVYGSVWNKEREGEMIQFY